MRKTEKRIPEQYAVTPERDQHPHKSLPPNMDSKDDNERISNGDGAGVGVGGNYNEFTSYLSGDIIPSSPPPSASSWAWAWASTTDDAAPTRDIEMGAVPDRPLNPSSLTTDQPPSSNDNGNGASDATRSAPAPDNIRPRQTSPAPLVMEGAHFEEQDDDAPVPPEMIAASFEAMKPELINEDDASVHDDQIAASFEAQDDEEEKREEDEDGDAPLPPEMIAELFEASDDVKQKAAKIPRMIEARTDENLNRVRDNINSIDQRGTDMPDSGADSLHEVVDNNDSPVSRESILYPSSMSSQQH